MSLFICAKCGCIENTAISSYWSITSVKHRNIKYHGDLQSYAGKPLCSECAKITFDRKGRVVMMPGQWHGKFPKVKATTEQIADCNPQTGIIEDWKK